MDTLTSDSFMMGRLQRKQLVSDPGKHHGTWVKHVPWFMSGSLTGGGGKNVPGIPGACTTRNFTYLARGPYAFWKIHAYYSIWRRHKNMSLCNGSRVYTNYERIASWDGCHFQTGGGEGAESLRHILPPTAVAGVHTSTIITASQFWAGTISIGLFTRETGK